MKNFVSLLLCLSLSVFAVARAMTPSRTLAAVTKTAQKKPGTKSRRQNFAGQREQGTGCDD